MIGEKNTRRDAGLSPNRRFQREGHRKGVIISVAIFILIALALGSVVVNENHSHGWYLRHTITVDGNPNDWIGSLPTSPDQGVISNGEYVWNDSIHDERDDFAIVPDGNLSDWNQNYFVTQDNPANDSKGADITGANITSLYVAWNGIYLYIYFNTSNKASWNTAYGIGIDTGPGGYLGDSSSTDAWGRNISFSGYGIDYELYFWYDSSKNNITSADICIWNSANNAWDYYDFENLNDSATTPDMPGADFANVSSSGLSYIELRLPWNGLGITTIPSQINITAWVAGGDGSSAVDSVPDDPSMFDNGTNEWNDHDTFTVLSNVPLNENNIARDERVDITEFRMTADSSYLYFLVKFNNLDLVGWSGAPAIMITIDKNASDTDTYGNTYFALYSDTQVNKSGYANWEYQIVIDLSRNLKQNTKINGTTDALNVYNISWKDVADKNSYFVVNKTNNSVEAAIYIPTLESDGVSLNTIRVEVGVVRGNGYGDSWDPTKGGGDGSDVLDAITTTGPNTWDEVSDGYLDYYMEINLTDIGFVPEVQPLILSTLFLAIPIIIRKIKK